MFKTFIKIYFWIIVLLLLAVAYLDAAGDEVLGIVDYLDYGFSLFWLIGVYGYGYDKTFLTIPFWKIYLPFIIIWDAYATQLEFGDDFLSQEPVILLIFAILFLVISLPGYIALYLYGYQVKRT